MALQGTIDSFALDDVLRLLGGSSKTGRLIVNGDRGSAHLWLADGRLVGGDTSSESGRDLVEVIFDVLRYQSGSFIFEADTPCPDPSEPVEIEPAIVEACAALDEWREIIAVVPSLDAVVTLAPELPHPEVVIDQPCWTSIVTIGGGLTVGQLGATFGLGELPVSRLVRALHSAGFVQITGTASTEAPTDGDADAASAETWFAAGADQPADDRFDAPQFDTPDIDTRHIDTPNVDAGPVGTGESGIDDAFVTSASAVPAPEPEQADGGWSRQDAGWADNRGSTDPDAEEWIAAPAPSPSDRLGDEATFFGGAEGGSDEGDRDRPATLDEALPPVPDAEELSRQMSMLSPKAAQAVAAAAAQVDEHPR